MKIIQGTPVTRIVVGVLVQAPPSDGEATTDIAPSDDLLAACALEATVGDVTCETL